MTHKQITQAIKKSDLPDNTINVCLHVHKENPTAFNNFIKKIEDDISMMVAQKGTIYEAYEHCKEVRTIRLSHDNSMIKLERAVIAMAGALSKYKKEIIIGDLLSQVRIYQL